MKSMARLAWSTGNTVYPLLVLKEVGEVVRILLPYTLPYTLPFTLELPKVIFRELDGSKFHRQR